MKRILLLTLIGLSCSVFKGNAQVNVQDSLALVDLYDSCGGASWTNHNGWLTKPINSWVGVTVASNGRVVHILLANDNLLGIVPASIKKFDSLQMLDLSSNRLSGNIPHGISNLYELTRLDLSNNQFSGNIPSFLSNLTKLQFLFLSGNKLTGSIPASFGNLDYLYDLELANNNLTGLIPSSFGSLLSLHKLLLSNNQLSGNIPSSLGSLGYEMGILDFSHNKLSGSIPASLGNLSILQSLNLSYNDLTDTIPASIQDFQGISLLFLNNNHFTFTGIENLFYAYQEHIGNLLLNFQGSPQTNIPLYFVRGNSLAIAAGGNISQNTYQWYAGSGLRTTITGDSIFTPSGFAKYSVIVSTTFTTNGNPKRSFPLQIFSDTAIPTVSATDSLALVDFYNSTKGSKWKKNTNWLTSKPLTTWYGVTESLDTLTEKISAIILPDNNLNGYIPSSFGNLNFLQHLNLSKNKLKDTLPASVKTLSSLRDIDISNNSFTGKLPFDLLSLFYLDSVNIAQNQFEDTIPTTIINYYFDYLNFSSNKFTFQSLIPIIHKGTVVPVANFPYSPQSNIPIHYRAGKLSVSPGGVFPNDTAYKSSIDTFHWYKNGVLVVTKVGDSKYRTTGTGKYNVTVTNSIATKLTLYSDTFTIAGLSDDVKPNPLTSKIASLYPNPTKDLLNISLTASQDETAEIKIADINGKVVLVASKNIQAGTTTQSINVSSLAKGTYIVEIKTTQGSNSVKFVKE